MIFMSAKIILEPLRYDERGAPPMRPAPHALYRKAAAGLRLVTSM
jgi:uncharacterized heparinase superfamily protein